MEEQGHLASSRSLSVCFPAYNEEATIGDVLQEAHELLSRSGLKYEILVCNDGSRDRTATIIDAMTARIPHLRVLHHSRNLGISATFEHLYSEAANEFIFLNSSDRQWATSIVFDMLPLTSDWDVIVASRIETHYGPMRRFISWGFNQVPSIVFGVRTFDAGAVKLMRREIIQRFTLVSRSPFSEAERLIRASRAGYRITQLPVEISARRTGVTKSVDFDAVLSSLKDVPRVWWSLRSEALAISHKT
jgi:glycosyltransferase involved in cell wall biosynthesis